MLIDVQYAWFIWSLILLCIWASIYFTLESKEKRREMLVVSLYTSLTGLTEPLFVPEYWSPPSLFNLNILTGFDIESVLWAFGIGGVAIILYERFFITSHRHIKKSEKNTRPHQFHIFALAGAPVLLASLLLLTDLNPIYASIIALIVGGIFTWYCRPDLKIKMFVSSGLFAVFYFVYFGTLIALFPDYVGLVWNLEAISGVLVFGVPLEELLFAFSFGFYWSSVYEHFTWRKVIVVHHNNIGRGQEA